MARPTLVGAANVIAHTEGVTFKPQKSVTITKFVREVKLWSTVWSESSATKLCDFGVVDTESKVELLRPPWIQTVQHAFQPLGKLLAHQIIL